MYHAAWKIITLAFLFILSNVSGSSNTFIGININSDTSDLPSPPSIISILKLKKIRHIRLPDADQKLLTALAKTGVEVMVSVPNYQLERLGKSRRQSANWINTNIVPHLPETNITHISVGEEVLTKVPHLALLLLRAMQFLHSALLAANLTFQIKISSPTSMDFIPVPFPPSVATFNSTWRNVTYVYLQFLKNTGSFFTLNAYPFLNYKKSKGIFPLDYALFRSTDPDRQIVDPNTLLEYTNMFDSMVDSAYFAMRAMNFSTVPIIVTASGWPWYGEGEATVENALVYNGNLIKHVLSGSGTPSRPDQGVSAYIYELFDEDLRVVSDVERHWGMLEANGSEVYSLDFEGFKTKNNSEGLIGSFCVAKNDAGSDAVKAGLDWACGPGSVNCTDVQPGGACYGDGDVAKMSSYVFDKYYHMMAGSSGACDFGGSAMVTHVDPSFGSCVFPGSNGSSTHGGGIPGPSSSSISGSTSGFQAVGWCCSVVLTAVALIF